ncbi:MAG TPA: hypothetical protein VLA05_06775, partial [Coriobacteriia bacterium]|nr:hypothetical protein [Coriobacteriia bacterium]
MPSILVCDTESDFARTIAQTLAPIEDGKVLYLSELEDAVSHARQGTSDVLLIGPSVLGDDACEASQLIRESSSHTAVVM